MDRERAHKSISSGSPARIAICGIAVTCAISVTACSTQTRGAVAEGEAQFDRPVTMYVGYGPGGGSDQAARMAAPVFADGLDVEVPVVNSPGGSGNTAFNSMLGDPPGTSIALYTDGNLVGVASGVASYELNELKGVCRLQEQPGSVLLKADGKYANWNELAEAAKKNPGELTIGTSGQGGIDDVMIAALAEQGVKLRAVPFDEPTERYSGLLGGSIDALFEQPGDVVDDIESGQMKVALLFADKAVDGLEGDYLLGPDVGVDLALNQSRGVVTSADADPAQIKELADTCAQTQEDSKWGTFQSQNLSLRDSYMNAEGFDQYLHEQLARFEKLARRYDIG